MSLYSARIGNIMGAWAIVKVFAAPLVKIPVESDILNKPVWENMDFLLDTGEPKVNNEVAECTVPQGPHVRV